MLEVQNISTSPEDTDEILTAPGQLVIAVQCSRGDRMQNIECGNDLAILVNNNKKMKQQQST